MNCESTESSYDIINSSNQSQLADLESRGGISASSRGVEIDCRNIMKNLQIHSKTFRGHSIPNIVLDFHVDCCIPKYDKRWLENTLFIKVTSTESSKWKLRLMNVPISRYRILSPPTIMPTTPALQKLAETTINPQFSNNFRDSDTDSDDEIKMEDTNENSDMLLISF